MDTQDFVNIPPACPTSEEVGKNLIQRLVFLEIQQQLIKDRVLLEETRKIVEMGLERDIDTIIATTPGSGKTFGCKKLIKRLHDENRRVLYVAPTIDKSKEFFAELNNISNKVLYEARNPENCTMFGACSRAMQLGLSPFVEVCQPRHKEFTEGEKRCKYLSQLDAGPLVVVGNHYSAPYILEKLEEAGFFVDTIVIDETPFAAMISTAKTDMEDSILLKMGFENSSWWQKIINYIRADSKLLGERTYIQEKIAVDKQHIEEMKNGGAWEGLRRVMEEQDIFNYNKRTNKTEKEKRDDKRQLDAINKKRFKEYEAAKKAFFVEEAKKSGLVETKYPDFVPTKFEAPEFKLTPMPKNRAKVEKVIIGGIIKTSEEEGLTRQAGVEGADIAEMALDLNTFIDQINDNEDIPLTIKEEEVRFWRAAMGMSETDTAYIQVTTSLRKNKHGVVERFENVELKVVMRRPWKLGKEKLFILDGTPSKKETEALFGREIELIRSEAQLHAMKTVFFKQNLGTVECRYLANPAKEDEAEAENKIRRILKRSIARLKETDKKVLLITFKALEEKALKIAQELAPELKWASIHYNGNRGINKYENFNAAIVFGTPYAPPLDFQMMSLELYGEIDRVWIARHGLRELIQSLHRIRPINHETTIVVNGNYWPSEGFERVNFDTDARRKGGQKEKTAKCVEKLVLVAEKHKCLTLEIAERNGVFCEEERAKIEKYEAMGKEALLYLKKEWAEIIRQVQVATSLPGAQQTRGGSGRARTGLGKIEDIKKACKSGRISFIVGNWQQIERRVVGRGGRARAA